MSATLKEMGQNIATMARVRVPNAIYGSSERNARSIFLSIKQACEDILRAEDWSQLTHDFEFYVNQGAGRVTMPPGVDHLVDKSVYSVTNNTPLIGPLNPAEFNRIIALDEDPRRTCYGFVSSEDSDSYATLVTFGTTRLEQCILDYVTFDHCFYIGLDVTPTRYFVSDNQVSKLDQNLIEIGGFAKFLRILGRSYIDEVEEFNDLLSERISRNLGSRAVRIGQGQSPDMSDARDCLANTGIRIVP